MKSLLLITLTSISAFAFTPPSDITPYRPENNVVGVEATTSTQAGVDKYIVSDTVVTLDKFGNCTSLLAPGGQINNCIYNVGAGTSYKQAYKLASGNNAWAKFKATTLTAAEQQNPLALQKAGIWFMNNIYKLY